MAIKENKIFKRSPLFSTVQNFQSPERIEENGLRLYTTDKGSYPSVTTVLGSQENKELEEWKKAVGEEEAKAISRRATRRGTIVHDMCENYLNNSLDDSKYNMLNFMSFNPIKKILDKHVDEIVAIETPLYSHKLKSAGTIDLAANYDGLLSAIDFKTSANRKYDDQVTNYRMQLSAYAFMLEELFGMKIEQTVIIMTVDGGESQIFKNHPKEYLSQYLKIRVKFKEAYGI